MMAMVLQSFGVPLVQRKVADLTRVGDLVLKTVTCGVCATDLRSWREPVRGDAFTCAGHEIASIVTGEEMIDFKVEVIAGDLEPVVTRRLLLTDANAALDQVASREHVGRTVLDFAV